MGPADLNSTTIQHFAENLKLVNSMAKVLQQARVVEIVLCVAFVLVAHLLEGCDKAGSGSGAADVMGLNNESSGVFDKLPTPAPTPAPPKCCDSSQYGKCCVCAAQSGAGFSAGFSICKGDNDCDCTGQDPTPGAKRSEACAGSKGPSYR